MVLINCLESVYLGNQMADITEKYQTQNVSGQLLFSSLLDYHVWITSCSVLSIVLETVAGLNAAVQLH